MQRLRATTGYLLFSLSVLLLCPGRTIGQDTTSALKDSLKQGVARDTLVAPQVANAPDMQERMMVLAIGLTVLAGFALLLFLKRREMDREAGIL